MLRESHSRNRNFWGLTIQRGPWKETIQDRRILKESEEPHIGNSLGRGGTKHAGHGNWNILLAPTTVSQPPPITLERIKNQSIFITEPLAIKVTPGKKRSITSSFKSETPIKEGITNNYNYNFISNGLSSNQNADIATETESNEIPLETSIDSIPTSTGPFISEENEENFDEGMPGSFPNDNIEVVQKPPHNLIIHTDDLLEKIKEQNLFETPSPASTTSSMLSELKKLKKSNLKINTKDLKNSKQSSIKKKGVRYEQKSVPRTFDELPSPKTRGAKRRAETPSPTSTTSPMFKKSKKPNLKINTKDLKNSKQSSIKKKGVRYEQKSVPRTFDKLPSPKTRGAKRRAKV